MFSYFSLSTLSNRNVIIEQFCYGLYQANIRILKYFICILHLFNTTFIVYVLIHVIFVYSTFIITWKIYTNVYEHYFKYLY